MSPHEEFLELCAVSTSGELTQEERRKLDEHLQGCASCREALEQFRQTALAAVPAITAEVPPNELQPDRSWSPGKAEAALFERLSKEDRRADSPQTIRDPMEVSDPARHHGYFPSRFHWGQMWMSYTAAALLFAALSISAYRVGIHRGMDVAANVQVTPGKGSDSLKSQLSDVSHDRDVLRLELIARDKAIDDLRQQVEGLKSTENVRVKESVASQKKQESRSVGEAASTNARLVDLQEKLDAAEKARSEDSSRAATLEEKLAELAQQLRGREEAVAAENRQLQSREGTIEQQQTQLIEQKELLDHDRDIRELMGARELYVAEVFDVGKDAATKKSYGRIFFTKGKSLIFYAYDLDRQSGAKNASTFQAWGQRGADREQTLNLGVFFEDSVSKKRWILKFDDAQKLAQIDAVFVTVEPNGGSTKPSTKPFLYAYLKVNPNHP
jgi:putative zinc finger protein